MTACQRGVAHSLTRRPYCPTMNGYRHEGGFQVVLLNELIIP